MIVLNHQVQNLFFFFLLPSHVSVLNSNCVSCYQILIFPPYAVLHKAQLLVSSRQPAHNQSNLFWVPQLRQINLLFTACPEIEGNTHHSRSGCVRVGEMGYFKKNSPLCCAADHSYQPPYIKGAINRRTGWYPRNGHRHHLLTKCQGKKQRGTKSANLICVMLDLV